MLIAAVFAATACSLPPERSLCSGREPAGSNLRIAPEDEPGAPMVITGQAWVGKGRAPLSATRMIVYHMNAEGRYARDGSGYPGAYLCGVLETDAEGRYRIETIRPGAGARGERFAHVHFEITTPWGQRVHDAFGIEGEIPGLPAGESWEEIRPAIRDDQGTYHVHKDFWVRY